MVLAMIDGQIARDIVVVILVLALVAYAFYWNWQN